MDSLDSDIYSFITKYGFKRLHSRLVEIMRIEYEYMQTQFQTPVSYTPVLTSLNQSVAIPISYNESESKIIQVIQEEPVIEESIKVKKPRKPRTKKVKIIGSIPQQIEVIQLETNTHDTHDTQADTLDSFIESTDKSGYRDSKDMKEYQKKSEEERRVINELAGIQLQDILTKENLKSWIEDEGRTYAWVAREKAGCADTQVAATAQMMGIKSKISMKRRKIMSGR